MTAPIPDSELASLRRLHEQATRGPWSVSGGGLGYDILECPVGIRNAFARKEDAEFIAAARNALPGLLERLRRVEEAVDAVLHDSCDDGIGDGDVWWSVPADTLRRLRAARAAAKGEG